MTPTYERERGMAKRKRWDPAKGEQPVPEGKEPETTEAEPETTGDPETPAEEATDEPEKPADEPGPLTKLQNAVRELLDFDQITEVRLALQGRREDLEKHRKKGAELGVYEPDTHRRIGLLDGSDTKFGLVRIFAREEATETRDLFFDAEKPNGRPDAEPLDGTITFRTVDGKDITCTFEQLETAARLAEVRALHRAGILPAHVEKAIRDGDFWHLIEDEAELATAGAES